MPNKTSSDGLVVFNEKYHTYTHATNGRLKGVTGLIEKYKNPFDREGISLRESERTGEPQADILARWDAKGLASRTLGSSCHAIADEYMTTGKLQITYRHPKELSMLKFINDFFVTGRLKSIGSEYLVHNGVIASMIDNVVENPAGDKFILDYKSNEEIKMKGYNGAKMLAPFDAYPDCHFIHYSMQTSIYKRLYTDVIAKSFVIHLQDEGYKFLECIDVPEVELVMSWY